MQHPVKQLAITEHSSTDAGSYRNINRIFYSAACAVRNFPQQGTVYIGASTGEAAEAARAMVNQIANPQMPEVGERFVGTVVKTTSFGAFVSLTPGKDGLLHISQVRRLVGGKRIDSVEDVLQVGQQVEVEIHEIGDRGKLSLYAVVDGETGELEASDEQPRRRERSERRERRPRTRTRRRREDDEAAAEGSDEE